MSEPLRILIADDHALFRRGICEVLEEGGTIRVVAEAGDGEEAVRLAVDLGTGGLNLVLMDLEMPKLNGIEATRRIRAAMPDVKIVVLTASIQDTDLFVSLDHGATGFLNKNMHPDALVRTLEDFGRTGGLAMTHATAAKALDYLQRQRMAAATTPPVEPPQTSPRKARSPRPDVAERLTDREREVIALVAIGMRDSEVAAHLSLSERTVQNHMQNIMRKLQVRNRTEAAARYLGGNT